MPACLRIGTGILVIGAFSLLAGCKPAYEVEYKLVASGGEPCLQTKVSGKAAELAVVLTLPDAQDNVQFISQHDMITNCHTESFSLVNSDYRVQPGMYKLMVKTVSPEQVVYRTSFELTPGPIEVTDVQLGGLIQEGRLFPTWCRIHVTNRGSLPVVFHFFHLDVGGRSLASDYDYTNVDFSPVAMPGVSVLVSRPFYPKVALAAGTYRTTGKLYPKSEATDLPDKARAKYISFDRSLTVSVAK